MSINSLPTVYRTLRAPLQESADSDAKVQAINAIKHTISGLLNIEATPDENEVIIDIQSKGFYPISAVIPQIRNVLGANVSMEYETTAHEVQSQEELTEEKLEETAAA